MKKYRNIDANKKTVEDTNKNKVTFDTGDYSYYSKVLKEPFNTVAELKKAEEAYYAKQKAKEDKAVQKKTDATKVEEAVRVVLMKAILEMLALMFSGQVLVEVAFPLKIITIINYRLQVRTLQKVLIMLSRVLTYK